MEPDPPLHMGKPHHRWPLPNRLPPLCLSLFGAAPLTSLAWGCRDYFPELFDNDQCGGKNCRQSSGNATCWQPVGSVACRGDPCCCQGLVHPLSPVNLWAFLIHPCFLFHCLTIGLAKNFVQLVNTLVNKIFGENEKCVFYFYLKPNELFGQSNTSLNTHFTAGKTEAWEGLESELRKSRDFCLWCWWLEPQQPGTVPGTQERLSKYFLWKWMKLVMHFGFETSISISSSCWGSFLSTVHQDKHGNHTSLAGVSSPIAHWSLFTSAIESTELRATLPGKPLPLCSCGAS